MSRTSTYGDAIVNALFSATAVTSTFGVPPPSGQILFKVAVVYKAVY
jgi:hypothetical protein